MIRNVVRHYIDVKAAYDMRLDGPSEVVVVGGRESRGRTVTRVGEIHSCMRTKEQEAPPFLFDRHDSAYDFCT